MPHYKHPVDPNGFDVVPQGFSLPEMFQRAHNGVIEARNAKNIAQYHSDTQMEIKRLEAKVAWIQKDLETVKYNLALAIGETQSAINVIMTLAGVNFNQARDMIINESNLDKYVKKAQNWLKTKPKYEDGCITSSRKALES